ncbi:MAG: quinol monooxygenase YgiN [Arenicella sp.]|jgi:quinol monooxygenase YgiN
MHIITAEIKALPAKVEQLTAILEAMLAPSRAEAGCISYRFFRSHDDSNSFLFYEQWQDMAAIEFHFATEHFQQLGAQLEGLLDGEPQINIFEASAVAMP